MKGTHKSQKQRLNFDRNIAKIERHRSVSENTDIASHVHMFENENTSRLKMVNK